MTKLISHAPSYSGAEDRGMDKTTVLKTLDGVGIPCFGLGVFQAQRNGETEQAVLWALKHGYRLVDTAALYK